MPEPILFLDGAMGTMLWQKGLKPGELPELTALTHPEWLLDIHRAYIEAGSNVIYANTFGANRLKLRGCGHRVNELVYASVALAKRAAAGTATRVALDVGPLPEMLEPMGTLPFETAVDIFSEVMRAGAEAGADLVIIETMTDLYEAKAALLAAKENTDLPVWVTMTFDEGGRTFTGCTVASMAATLEGLGADAIGVNCSLGPKQLTGILRELCETVSVPVIAKPNAGLPDPVDGHYDMTPEEFAAELAAAVDSGVAMLGGCCGTSPAYIRALKKAYGGRNAAERQVKRRSIVCTPTRPVAVDGVRVIGERINPTGKKRFQQALLEGDIDYIVDVGLQEMDAGAEILDVNVGYPGVDEVTMLPLVVKRLQSVLPVPLQLDSTNAEALAAGLRVYNGKAAVNSVNGEKASIERVLPVVKKYGAAVVGLTLDENGIPDTAEKRVAIAERIAGAAESLGIPREDVWIDCLTLTVSAQQAGARETLKAVEAVTRGLGLRTVLGVSNISFGLPMRPLMTRVFLAAALDRGLSLPIINPNQGEMMDTIAAWRVLNGEDAGCRDYVDRFADAVPAAASVSAAPKAPKQAVTTLDEAILRGLKQDAARLAKEQLNTEAPLSLVENHLIPALDRVGEDYEHKRAFLPQLLGSAQAAEAVFGVIREALARSGEAPVKKGRLIIATVKGDIHDIGKNIVKTVLENYGYEVLDLGRDVPPEAIVDAVTRDDIRLVGLSALMTTTLPAMEDTVRLLKALPQPPAVMVGGAVVTQDYAERIGADAYASDARAAVEIARRVLN